MVSSSRRHESGDGPSPGADPDYDYPKDEFDIDDWGGPVGAHRAARKSWFVALPWLVGAAVILLLTGVALSLGLGRSNDGNTAAVSPSASNTASTSVTVTTSAPATSTQAAPSAAASASQSGSPSTSGTSSTASSASATATVDKKTQIQILNATRRTGLAHELQTTMRGSGWNVGSVDTYRKGTPPSVVYYRDPTDKATAAAVAKLYGLGTKQSQGWTVPLTLMIGNDFPK